MGIVEEHWREFSETNKVIDQKLKSINSNYDVIDGTGKYANFKDEFGKLTDNCNVIIDEIKVINACLTYHTGVLDKLTNQPEVKRENEAPEEKKEPKVVINNKEAITRLKELRRQCIDEIKIIDNYTSDVIKNKIVGVDFKHNIDDFTESQNKRLNDCDNKYSNIYANSKFGINNHDWNYVIKLNEIVAAKEKNISKRIKEFNTIVEKGKIPQDQVENKMKKIKAKEAELNTIQAEFSNNFKQYSYPYPIGNINADYSEFERNTNNRNEGAVIDGNDKKEIKKRIDKLSREIEETENQREKKNLTTIKKALQKVYERNIQQERASTSRIQSNRRPPTPKPTSGLPPKKPRRTSSLKSKKRKQTSNLPKYVELNDANTPPENERNTQADLGFTFNNHYETQGGINSHENIQNMKNMNGGPYLGIDHQGYDYYNDPYFKSGVPRKNNQTY